MCSSNPGFLESRFSTVEVFQGPGFHGPGPGSGSRVRFQVTEVAFEVNVVRRLGEQHLLPKSWQAQKKPFSFG